MSGWKNSIIIHSNRKLEHSWLQNDTYTYGIARKWNETWNWCEGENNFNLSTTGESVNYRNKCIVWLICCSIYSCFGGKLGAEHPVYKYSILRGTIFFSVEGLKFYVIFSSRENELFCHAIQKSPWSTGEKTLLESSTNYQLKFNPWNHLVALFVDTFCDVIYFFTGIMSNYMYIYICCTAVHSTYL